MLAAPSLQTEQRARRFEYSSSPPCDLSLIWPIWSRVFLPSKGCTSPAAIPHIWQVKPFLSRTCALVSFDMVRAKEGRIFVSTSRYWPGRKSLLSLCVTIFMPSSLRSSLTRLAHSLLLPDASRMSSDSNTSPTCWSKKAFIFFRAPGSRGGIILRSLMLFCSSLLTQMQRVLKSLRRLRQVMGRHFLFAGRRMFSFQRTAMSPGNLGCGPSCAQ